MRATARRVLGVDTSLRSCGYGVVEARGNRFSVVEFGSVRNAAKRPLSECLLNLEAGLTDVIRRCEPGEAAVEGIFYFRNAKTALVLGEARGVAILCCVKNGLDVFEYAPRRVKQAVVGSGSADKQQVRKMVAAILGIREELEEDAGDALGIAICHLHAMTGFGARMQQAI